jgi:branched-subunit amino acid transport protein
MTVAWITIAALAVATALIKASGPVTFGGRELPGLLERAIPLLAPALLAALVVTQTFGAEAGGLTLDARAAGLTAAAAALGLRAPILVVLGVAAVVTGGLRAMG